MLVMAVLATLVVFLIANTVPGDPVLAQLGDQAASDPVFVAEWRHQYGLDRPLWERYVIFLDGLRHGDLGRSIRSRRPVLDDVEEYGPATIELATVSFALTLLIGIPLGVARRGETRYLGRSPGARHLAVWAFRRRPSGSPSSCSPSSTASSNSHLGLAGSIRSPFRRRRSPDPISSTPRSPATGTRSHDAAAHMVLPVDRAGGRDHRL